MCLEILAKRGCAFTLKYIRGSVADVDCPTDLVGLIRQRRRWLNGTFFALVFALHKWGAIYEHTKHSVFRKFTFF